MVNDAWGLTAGTAAFERARALEAVSARRRFEGLVARHSPRLRGVAFAMLGAADAVDDVLQDSFARAYPKLPRRFESERHEAAWLYKIVFRCCLNELRRRRRRPEVSVLATEYLSEPTDEPGADFAVASVLADLPIEQRAVVLLVDLVGFDYEATARILRIPRGTVASRLNAARTRLRVALEEGETDV
ncbi:MAG TPA: RNA polymerase sigma factor [Solirubrobacteraceae bacterium]